MTPDAASPTIGLIGLGNAGGALLEALSAHYCVQVYDRDSRRIGELLPRCHFLPSVATTAADLALSAELVILSLPTPEASRSVAEEIRSVIGEGTTVVESSTVGVGDVEALHALLAPTGAKIVDVPLVGGVQRLSEGQAVFLAGTTEADAGLIGTVFGSIASEIFFLGTPGNGMRTKLILNSIAHVVYVALVEAGALAAAQDIPLAMLQQLLERESGLIRPLTHRFGERLRDHDFAGGMSTANARKDSAIILDTARRLGVPLFATSAAHSVYELAVREGLGPFDYAAIGTLWEKWLGVSMRQG